MRTFHNHKPADMNHEQIRLMLIINVLIEPQVITLEREGEDGWQLRLTGAETPFYYGQSKSECVRHLRRDLKNMMAYAGPEEADGQVVQGD